MAYTRAQMTQYLSYELAALTAEAKLLGHDYPDGFAPSIDKALRALGTAEAALSTATVTDGDVPAYMALSKYHALVRIWATIATRADVQARNVMGPRAQVFQHVRDLVNLAAAECATYGYPVGAVEGGPNIQAAFFGVY
jgi:hypothetical protein